MRLLLVLVGGAIFGAGLVVSGMAKQEVVLSFLHLEDLGLMLVMAGGIAVAALTFQLAPRLRTGPIGGGSFSGWQKVLDRRTLLGAVIFGVGWGLSGVCPGSAIASVGLGNWPALLALVGMLAGAWMKGFWFDRRSER